MAGETNYTLTERELLSLADRSGTAAAERVGGYYRFRTVLSAALAGAVVSCAVAIPTTLIVSHNATSKADKQAQANSESNCRNISSVATIEQAIYADEATQTRLFLAQSNDRFGLTPAQFAKLEGEREARERRRINALKAIATTICGAEIQPPPAAKASPPAAKAKPPPPKS